MKTKEEIQSELDNLYTLQEQHVALGYKYSWQVADRVATLEWVLGIPNE